jgi:hypothetical protein
MVKLGANVSRNDYLAASGTAGAATGATGASGGAFAQALYAGSSGNLVPAMVSAGGSTGDSGLFTINAVVTGGPSVPQTGNQFAIVCDIDLTIVANTLVAIQTGSAVVDVLKSTYAGYSGSLTSICASAKPTLSSAIKSQDTTLTGWTTSINAGDILVVELESIATITSVTLALKCRRGH